MIIAHCLASFEGRGVLRSCLTGERDTGDSLHGFGGVDEKINWKKNISQPWVTFVIGLYCNTVYIKYDTPGVLPRLVLPSHLVIAGLNSVLTMHLST